MSCSRCRKFSACAAGSCLARSSCGLASRRQSCAAGGPMVGTASATYAMRLTPKWPMAERAT
eukprot:5309768-Alexandrium_andersonii.AAC.1